MIESSVEFGGVSCFESDNTVHCFDPLGNRPCSVVLMVNVKFNSVNVTEFCSEANVLSNQNFEKFLKLNKTSIKMN